jgi:hypothetical protein
MPLRVACFRCLTTRAPSQRNLGPWKFRLIFIFIIPSAPGDSKEEDQQMGVQDLPREAVPAQGTGAIKINYYIIF